MLIVRFPEGANVKLDNEGGETFRTPPLEPWEGNHTYGTLDVPVKPVQTGLRIAAGKTALLKVRAEVVVPAKSIACGEYIDPIFRRHAFFSHWSAPRVYEVRIAQPVGISSTPARLDTAVQLPRSWRAWREGPSDEEIENTTMVSVNVFPPPERGAKTWRFGSAELRFSPPERQPIPGGPFVGIGTRSGTGFQARAGWEIAAPRPLIHALAVEGGHQRWRVVASTEIAPNLHPLLPGFGLGVPVEFLPTPRVGGRAFFNWSLVLLDVIAHVDVLSDRGRVGVPEAGLLVQGGL